MSSLAISDRVLTLDVDTGKLFYDDVIAFTHRLPVGTLLDSGGHRYTHMHLEGGGQLTTTPRHLVYSCSSTKASTFESCDFVFADQIRPDDYVIQVGSEMSNTSAKSVRVVKVTGDSYDGGLFSPLTTSGTIIVDDVLVSNYASIPSHRMMHWLWAPLRLANGLARYFDLQEFRGVLSEFLSESGETLRRISYVFLV